MSTALRRYDFSERLADILGESRRDLRVRVTLLISGGLIRPGPRGPGAPPATADYAADLLIGVMAAPLQVHTVDAIRCYRALVPTRLVAGDGTSGIVLGAGGRPRLTRNLTGHSADPIAAAAAGIVRPPFGEAVARLLALARTEATRTLIARDVFGVWLSRGFPVAAIQLATWTDTGRSITSQRYELPPATRPPAWLDPERGGSADTGLAHSVFLPVDKLIAIGALITPSDDERMPPVIDLGQKIASLSSLAQLARETRHRRPWQSFLSAAAAAEDTAARIDARDAGLVEVFDFGGNPGNLRMLTHVPDDLPTGAALVVVLHGCTQTAASYDRGTGWSTLADRHGFALLLPEQRRANNPLRCFNWFRGEDHARESGEARSIREMVARMIADARHRSEARLRHRAVGGRRHDLGPAGDVPRRLRRRRDPVGSSVQGGERPAGGLRGDLPGQEPAGRGMGGAGAGRLAACRAVAAGAGLARRRRCDGQAAQPG